MATKIVSQPKLRFWERLYFPRIFQGLKITGLHVLKNLRRPKDMPTVSYPEVQVVYPPAFRGMHRLTVKPSGEEKCTACMLCATACPADCIHIVAEEHPDPSVEKHPLSYDINTLRCVYCGFCVEACPVDAIRMDTGMHPPPGRDRGQFWEDKQLLMGRSARFSVAEGGLTGAPAALEAGKGGN